MLKSRAATWRLVSMVWLWIGLAAATPPEPGSGPPAAGQTELRGVVIEEIPKGSSLEKAGLQAGDVITAWKRLPSPPANPEAAEGVMASYFDWQELEVEQAPRGTVVLRGRRGSEPLEVAVTPGLWEIKVRPVLSPMLEAIYAEGKARLAGGDPEGAARIWWSLAEPAGRESGLALRTWVTLRIGESYEETTRWEKAVEVYRDAIASAGSANFQVVAWEALGQVEAARSNFEEAEKVFTSALKIREKTSPGSLGVASVLNNLGFVFRARGAIDSAQSYLLRAQEIYEQYAPQSLELSTVFNNLGTVVDVLGDLNLSETYNLRSLKIREHLAPESFDLTYSLINLGFVASSRGDLAKAEGYYLRALRTQERLAPESCETAVIFVNLGVIAHDRGELDRAHDYYLRALQLDRQCTPPGLEIATDLNNLGNLAHHRGELDRAKEYYLRALQIEEQLAPASLTIATSLNNLGALARDRGDLDSAYGYHMKALAIRKRLAPRSLECAYSLNNLGNVAGDRGDWSNAHSYYLSALRRIQNIAPDSLDVALGLNNLGAIAQARREVIRAQEYHRRALEIRQRLAPQSLDVADSLNSLGQLARIRGDFVGARSYQLRALESLEHQVSRLGGSYKVQAGFRSNRRSYYLDLLDLLITQSLFSEAFPILERFRAQTFLTMLAERDVAFTADIPEELDRERRRIGVLYDTTLKRLAGLKFRDHAGEIEATHKELRKLDDEAGDVEARIRSTSPKLAALRYPQPLDAAAAQQALDPGTLLLSFSVGKDKTALFSLSRSGELEVKTLPVGEAALRTRIQQLLSLLREARQGSSIGELRERRIEAVGRELYASLLGPVAGRIAASERLLILPDGPLHSLPFAALVRDTEEGPQYLAAWKPLHVVLSATVYAELKQRRHPASETDALPVSLQLAAFGDPVYPQHLVALKKASTGALPAGGADRGDPTVRAAAERGLFDFQPLPYTRREVLGIASLFPAGTARTFLGPEALEERIKSLDPGTRILHIAAHGSTDEHLPSGSFLALTIPADAPAADVGPQHDNGLLQVWEIFERVRLHADLVVLSACDTGLGEELGGEGLIGLTRAFQYAGARSVLASLWSVNDQATSELMIRFYKHLLAGLPKDQALQAAQQELIHGPIEVTNEQGERERRDFSAPFFWAGFQLYGDWQ